MDYENFKESLIDGIKENFYEKGIEDMSFREQGSVNKLNGGYDGVVITPDGSNIGVTLNISALYEAYEDGAPMNEIVDKATQMAIKGIENQPAVDVAALTDYSQMKDKLVMEVVSAEANADMLQNIPHQNLEDMAVVYRFLLDSNKEGSATILVTNNLIETMGVTPEQLHADAVENAPKLRPAEITGMSEVMVQMMGREQAEMMGIFPVDPADEQMYVASVSDKNHGAGILAYQDFMEQASERLGGQSYFVLPSSLHEVLLVPDNGNMSLSDLEAMVKEVNATQVAPQDKLTDSVYHYDAEAKVFELGEKFVARQAEKEADIDSEEEAKDSVLGDLAAKKDEVAKQPKKEAKEKSVNKNKGGEAI